jgi:hypothetical protein
MYRAGPGLASSTTRFVSFAFVFDTDRAGPGLASSTTGFVGFALLFDTGSALQVLAR